MTYQTKHIGLCTTITGPNVTRADIAAMLAAMRAQTPTERAADVAAMDAKIQEQADDQ